MGLENQLGARASGQCELCSSKSDLLVYDVQPNGGPSVASCALICQSCADKINTQSNANPADWRFIADAMWSEQKPVQVLCYRILSRMQNDAWAAGLLGQLYLDEDALSWATKGLDSKATSEEGTGQKTVDSNGTQLQTGDSVTLIKDLEVKGANFTAKRGTLVKNINLTDDPKFIEGRVNGTTIVLVAAYLKKA
jgi:protein PhnA